MNAVTYPSKVDWWIGLLILSVPVLALATAIGLQASGNAGEAILGWVVLAAIGAMYVGIVWPVRYELQEDRLVIRFGLARATIPYAAIRGVRPSRSLLASPALSLDRLAIDTGRGLAATISPADRDRFLDDLATRVPHLVREGDALTTREER